MYKLIIIIVLLSVFGSCQEGDTSTNTLKCPNSEHRYINFISNDGAKPNVGDFVYFTMNIYDDRDSVLQKNTQQSNFPSIQVTEGTNVNRQKNPILDVLCTLAVGDSAAILIPIDSIKGGVAPELQYIKNFQYHVTVKEILTAEENKAKRDKQIAALSAVVEEVEVLTQETLDSYKSGSLQYKTTPAGVKYHIHEEGEGALPTKGQMVTMSYFGRTVSTGVKFDESFSKGRGYSFRLGMDSVIQGWHDAGQYLPQGTRASIFIPAELGYGAQGSPPVIPANAELYFYVVVDDVKN